jgi:hypothetical protein
MRYLGRRSQILPIPDESNDMQIVRIHTPLALDGSLNNPVICHTSDTRPKAMGRFLPEPNQAINGN